MRKNLTDDDIKMYNKIRNEIKTMRKSLKMTQAELAEKVNVSVNYISQIETGYRNPDLSTIREIYTVLGIPALKFSDAPSNNNLAIIERCKKNLDTIHDFIYYDQGTK